MTSWGITAPSPRFGLPASFASQTEHHEPVLGNTSDGVLTGSTESPHGNCQSSLNHIPGMTGTSAWGATACVLQPRTRRMSCYKAGDSLESLWDASTEQVLNAGGSSQWRNIVGAW